MRFRLIKLSLLGFTASLCFAQAEEWFRKGSAYPKDLKGEVDLTLSAFVSQKTSITDWSLVVIIRGTKHYILNKKENRGLLAQPAEHGDLLLVDEAATAFLGWRRQNPEADLNTFLNANPQIASQALRYAVREGASRATTSGGIPSAGDSKGAANGRDLPLAAGATDPKPSTAKPASETPKPPPAMPTKMPGK